MCRNVVLYLCFVFLDRKWKFSCIVVDWILEFMELFWRREEVFYSFNNVI